MSRLGIYASQISGHLSNPSFESISTVTLTGSQSSVTFSSIPSTYKHLQIRFIARTNRTNYSVEQIYMRFNGDTGSNYSTHVLGADGASTYAYTGSFPNTWMYVGQSTTNLAASNAFGSSVVDVLDYTSTSKNKTSRTLNGTEPAATYTGNIYGTVNVASGLWMSSSAISSITFITELAGNFLVNSKFALYGVKG